MKESVSIPVIGNGDIKSCYDAKKMLEQTGCDAIMIGRGCLGNPWLIKECVNYLEQNIEPEQITKKEKLEMILEHLKRLENSKNEKVAVLEMRSHITWYLKGISNTNELKEQIFKINKIEELKKLIKDYMDGDKNEC